MKKQFYSIILLCLFCMPIYAWALNDSTSTEQRGGLINFISLDVGSNFTFFSNYVNSSAQSQEIAGMTKRARGHFGFGFGLNPFNSNSFKFLLAVENNNHDLKATVVPIGTINNEETIIEYDFNYASVKFGGLLKLIELGNQSNSFSVNLKAGIDANFLLSGFQYKQGNIIDLKSYQPFKNNNLDYFLGLSVQKQISPITSLQLSFTKINGFKLEEFNSEKQAFEQYVFKTDLLSLGVLVNLDQVKVRKEKEKEIDKLAENLKNELKDNEEFKNDSEQKIKKLIKQLNDSDKKIGDNSELLEELKNLIEKEAEKDKNSDSDSDYDIFSFNKNKRLVLFPFGKDQFYSAFNKELDELVVHLDSVGAKIKLIGYADIVGANKYNLELSKRRAKSVEKYLIKKGVDPNKISVEFKGATTKFDRYNFLFNRRVEINLIK